MDILNFFPSVKEILEFVVLVIELIMFFRPEQATVNIDNSTKYYFSNSNTKVNSESEAWFKAILSILITYFLYSLLFQYFTFVIILLTLLLLMKYRRLNIQYRLETITPISFVLVAFSLNFLPEEVNKFWQSAYKFDFSKVGVFSELKAQLETGLTQISSLFFTLLTDPNRFTVSICSTLAFVFLASFILLSNLFRKKTRIRVSHPKEVVASLFVIFTLWSLIFVHVPWSPANLIYYYFTH